MGGEGGVGGAEGVWSHGEGRAVGGEEGARGVLEEAGGRRDALQDGGGGGRGEELLGVNVGRACREGRERGMGGEREGREGGREGKKEQKGVYIHVIKLPSPSAPQEFQPNKTSCATGWRLDTLAG